MILSLVLTGRKSEPTISFAHAVATASAASWLALRQHPSVQQTLLRSRTTMLARVQRLHQRHRILTAVPAERKRRHLRRTRTSGIASHCHPHHHHHRKQKQPVRLLGS